MATNTISSATTTDIKGSVQDFSVSSMPLDTTSPNGDTYWYFSDATKNFGYYSKIPEIFSAANALATWAVGKGWESDDVMLKQELKFISGMGKDTFDSIMWNHEVVKLIVGDAFAEIIREKDTLVNLLPISPERVRLVLNKGRIKHYEIWNGKKWVKKEKNQILHSTNNRIGDQVHGTSQIDATKWIIDARNEALEIVRVQKNRSKALGIVYYKTDNTGKITYANKQIEKAVKNGEMVGLPEDVAKIEGFPKNETGDIMAWISYLENFFYQTFGVPRSIATSDGTSEVGGKMGHVIFEPIYAREQRDLEQDLWNQCAIEITFNRPPSLGGLMQQEEQKNTGQINIQPNDVAATMTRE